MVGFAVFVGFFKRFCCFCRFLDKLLSFLCFWGFGRNVLKSDSFIVKKSHLSRVDWKPSGMREFMNVVPYLWMMGSGKFEADFEGFEAGFEAVFEAVFSVFGDIFEISESFVDFT